MSDIGVIVWGDERQLVSALEARGSGLTVVRHCEDLAEVLGSVGGGLASVVVLAGPASDIDAGFIEALQRVGGAAIALAGHEAEVLRLRRLGAMVVPVDATAEAVAHAVREAIGAAPSGAVSTDIGAGLASGTGSWGQASAQGVRGVPVGTDSDRPDNSPGPAGGMRRELPGAPGRITTVWGTGGAPGRSLVALNLAVEAAMEGARVVLVDADTHGASLAPMLGLLDETAGLVRLCRAVENGSFDPSTDSEAFARTRMAGAALRFTSGLPRPERWAEVSARSLTRALRALAAVADEVIVDIAAPVSRDDELALDTFAPQRNDAALAALGVADRILAVGQGDPVSLPRLMRLCEDAATLPSGPKPTLVVNQVRPGIAGARPESSIRRAWERFGPKGLTPQHFLPWDQGAADAALWKGQALAECAPRSQLRARIRELALTAR